MAGSEKDGGLSLPEEIKDSIEDFAQSLNEVDEVLQPFLSVPLKDLKEKLDPLQCAKSDLVLSYTVNSLFWMYLIMRGINPRDHPIKDELDRIKKYMGKLKEISDKKKASKLNKGAAKRFVKSALWTPDKGEQTEGKKGGKRKETSSSEGGSGKKKQKQD